MGKKCVHLFIVFMISFALIPLTNVWTTAHADDGEVYKQMVSLQEAVAGGKAKKAPKLTNKKALTLYKKAEKVANWWLLSGCYYMDDDYDNVLTFEENGETVEAIPIRHESIDSVAKLKKYLSKYFSKDVYDYIVSNEYRDIDGKLYYAAPYGIGGPFDYKLKSVKIKSQKNGTVKINIKINEIDNKKIRRVLSRNVKLVYKDGKWLFKKPFYTVAFGAEIKRMIF